MNDAELSPPQKQHSKRSHIATVATIGPRTLHTLPELAADGGVSRRFLEMEIARGHLAAVRMSSRVLRVRAVEWDRYLSARTTNLVIGGTVAAIH